MATPDAKRQRTDEGKAPFESALVVIDMQNDFCLPDRALCVKGAMGCLPKVEEAVTSARNLGVPVFWVCREHDPSGANGSSVIFAVCWKGSYSKLEVLVVQDPATLEDGPLQGCDIELTRQHLFQNGGKGTCVRGTEGAELVAPLCVQPGDHYIPKQRWSAFFATRLNMCLRRLGVTKVVLAGVQTPNCIRGTAYDAVALDYPEVIVLSDATASKNDTVQEYNLQDMRDAKITVVSTEEWVASLK